MNDFSIDDLIMINSEQNITDDDKRYMDAIGKYKKAFGYLPHFISLPDPTFD